MYFPINQCLIFQCPCSKYNILTNAIYCAVSSLSFSYLKLHPLKSICLSGITKQNSASEAQKLLGNHILVNNRLATSILDLAGKQGNFYRDNNGYRGCAVPKVRR